MRGGELTPCVGPSLRPVDPGEFLRPALAGGKGVSPPCRIHLARCGWPVSSEAVISQTQENVGPREGFALPLRARVKALEVVPVRRICLQKSVGGDGPMKRLPNVKRGGPLTGT